MENLSLENFSPKKAELVALADKYKSLIIDGVEDETGYKLVDTARKDLKTKRREIERFVEEYLKQIRDKYNEKRKEALDIQEDHIGLIGKIEDELKSKQEKIDEERLKIERQVLLPERKSKLEKIEVSLSDEELLSMSPEEFTIFYNEKNGIYLEEKERKLREEEERVKREKELEEVKKQARIEAERIAKEEAEKKEREAKEREEILKKEAEEAKEKAVKEAERKAEEEKRRIIEEQERKERERIEAEDRAKQEQLKKEKEEKEAQEKLEKQKKYQKFLSDNGYTEESKSEFHIEKTAFEVKLYKIVATFEL